MAYRTLVELLMAHQLWQRGLRHIPPVTVAVVAFNVFLYVFPATPLIDQLSTDQTEIQRNITRSHFSQTCVSLRGVVSYHQWDRLLLNPLHHGDFHHIYANMISFLRRGPELEHRLGGMWFLFMLLVFSFLTGPVFLLLQAPVYLLNKIPFIPKFSLSCVAGFSGVLFALNTVINHYNPSGVIHMMSFSVPNVYASWVELLLIYVMYPEASFVMHLAGILVGRLYVVGPLEKIMKFCTGQRWGEENEVEAEPEPVDPEEVRRRRLRCFD